MPPPEIHVFTTRQIALGPDEIRGQVGSWAFIYTKYADPKGNRWFVQPGYVGHEQMTNTHGMLQAFFGAKAGEVAEQVVSIGDVYSKNEQGQYVSTGQQREIWDWRTIRLLAKRENLFGRSGTLGGRQVVMLWGDPPGWEAMLVVVLGHLGIGREDEAVVVLGNLAQYEARGFLASIRHRDHLLTADEVEKVAAGVDDWYVECFGHAVGESVDKQQEGDHLGLENDPASRQ